MRITSMLLLLVLLALVISKSCSFKDVRVVLMESTHRLNMRPPKNNLPVLPSGLAHR